MSIYCCRNHKNNETCSHVDNYNQHFLNGLVVSVAVIAALVVFESAVAGHSH